MGVSDEHLEDLIDDTEGGDLPDFRVTVVDGQVHLVDWTPALVYGGPTGQLFVGREEAGVAIADVTLYRNAEGDRDAVVEFLSRGDEQAAREALTDWAQATGQRRIWFSDAMVELDDEPARTGTARTTCTSCGAPFREAWHEFWVGVRESGRFPSMCPLCGGTLPQWIAGETDGADRGQAHARGKAGDASPR